MKLKDFIKINEQPVPTANNVPTQTQQTQQTQQPQQTQQVDDKTILAKISAVLKTGKVVENLNNVLTQLKAMNPQTQAQYQKISNSISMALQSLGGLAK